MRVSNQFNFCDLQSDQTNKESVKQRKIERKRGQQESMLVVTYATSDQGYFRALEQCCIRNGFQLVVLGWGEKFESFMQKPLAYLSYLKKLPDDTMTIVVDAFDVLILQTADEVHKRYQTITHGKQHPQLVVGVDHLHGPWLLSQFTNLLFAHSCSKRNLNVGVMIGPASVMLWVHELIIAEYRSGGSGDDDQKALNKTCSAISENITVDDTGFIITTTNPFDMSSSELLKTKPCILHATTEKNVDEICRRFGLPIRLTRTGKSNQTKVLSCFRNHGASILFVFLTFCVLASVIYVLVVNAVKRVDGMNKT